MIESHSPESFPKHTSPEEPKTEEEQTFSEETISSETYKKVQTHVEQTLSLPDESPQDLRDCEPHWESLNTFAETLYNQVQKLPIYQNLKSELENTSQETLPFQLYELLTAYLENHPPENDSQGDNGVLLNSMAHGYLECAGQVLVASNILEAYNITHYVIEAPGHSFLLIEQDPHTLLYFDTSKNILFSFPQNSLNTSDSLEETTARKFELGPEFTDHISIHHATPSPINPEGIQFAPREGNSRIYLENVEAAFAGLDEFQQTNQTETIPQNLEYRDALEDLKKQFYTNYEQPLEEWEQELDNQNALLEDLEHQLKGLTEEYLKLSETEETFVTNFIHNILLQKSLHQKLRTYFPHIIHLPRKEQENKAAEIWRQNQ